MSFFVDKVEKIRSNIQPQTHILTGVAQHTDCLHSSKTMPTFESLTNSEVEQLIGRFKPAHLTLFRYG